MLLKNDYFTSQNVALPIYLDSENVDSIYKGEASYNDIKKTPIGAYVYIPTNTAIMNAGKLQFWFEDKNGSSNKYTCTLSNVTHLQIMFLYLIVIILLVLLLIQLLLHLLYYVNLL